jgi:small subunit ribosomal protein S27
VTRLNLDEFYHGLEQKYNHTGVISGVDVDIFTISVKDDSHLDEVEDVVYKLRQSANAKDLMPSTGHFFVRLLHHCGRTDELVKILHDRLNYGIFVDHHSSNFLMDEFLKAGKLAEAAKIGVLHGLQEDSSNEITNHLTLLACVQNLVNDLSWELEGPPQLEEPAEEVKVRIRFLRNPYNDGHFDLLKSAPLVGKTLANIAPALKDKTMAKSLELLGWALLEDWQKLDRKIKTLDTPVLKEALELAQKHISKAKEAEDHKVPPGLEESLQSVKSVDGNLLELMETLVKKAVLEFEGKDIEAQEKRYLQWEEDRQHYLAKQLRENEIRQRAQSIEEKKKYLEEKEQLLSYFENEDKYDLLIEELDVAEEKRKLEAKEVKKDDSDTYLPPEVDKRHNSSA